MRICVIGGGGKTTACLALARAFAQTSVLLTTTTHIYPVTPPHCRELLTDPDGEGLERALSRPGIVCAGRRGPEGKLAALPPEVLARGMSRAAVTVCEGDGSRHRPLKLHRPGEPVMLPGADLCLVVAGLSALGRPVGEAVHCFDLHPRWAEEPERPVGVEEFCACVEETVRVSGMEGEKVRVLLNQQDLLTDPAPLRAIERRLGESGISCRGVSLREGMDEQLIRALLAPETERRSGQHEQKE